MQSQQGGRPPERRQQNRAGQPQPRAQQPQRQSAARRAPQPGQSPGPRRRSENRWFRAIIMVLATIGACIFLAVFALQIANDLFGLNQPDNVAEIEIPENATLGMVSSILKEAGVIDNTLIFRIYSGLQADDEDIVPGEYVFNSNMGYNEIMLALRTGNTAREVVTLRFIEGRTLREIADALEEARVCDAQEFIDFLDSAEYEYEFYNMIGDHPLRFHKLEGYIFPDTYDFYVNEKVEEVARKFIRRFAEMIDDDMFARMQQLGLTLDQTITLASIIQREAGDEDEMKLVSSVFHNRLDDSNTYPNLQSDVTILYVENNIKPYLQRTNQPMYDAYNTYVCEGLPVGPICNPGIDAINAALYPENTGTDFYFFVTDMNGTFYYATNATDHYNNVAIAMSESEGGEVHGVDTH